MGKLTENTKPQKSDYTHRAMNNKGVYEAHEMTKEHGYLGEARQHLENGYGPKGSAGGEGHGTSYTLEADAGDIQRLKTIKAVK
jgi:hypothetical protein